MRARTFSSSPFFQLMNSSMSGWSMSRMTILAARRVVPPDLMAPAARSPIRRKDIPAGGRTGIGVGGRDGAPGGRVHVPEALGRAGQPVGVVEAGVEPLRAVGGGHLVDQHVAQFVLEGVGLRGEVAAALAPPAPRGGEALDDLAGGALGPEHDAPLLVADRIARHVELGDSRLA